MRWLFLFVLSLNLAYFAWQTIQQPVDTHVDVKPLTGVPPIVLLSEVGQLEKETEVVADTSSAPDAAESASVTDEKAPVVVSEKLSEAATTESTTAEATTVEVQAKVSGDATKAEKPPVVAAKPSPEPAPAKPVPEQVSASARCFTLGPFQDLDKLRSLTREIKSYVVEADFRGREEKEPAIYWVYLAPEKDRKAAVETGKRLKSKKIKDFYIIRDGDKINGISLGHFRNKAGAYGLAKRVTKLGFDVQVEPVFRAYTIYWLDYQLADGVSIPESIFDKYTKNTKKDKVSRLQRECAG